MTLMLNIKHSNMIEIDVCPDCVQMKYQDKGENNFIFGMPSLKLETKSEHLPFLIRSIVL